MPSKGRSKFHEFKDSKGKPIGYAVLEAALSQSEYYIREGLKQESKIPENFHIWLKKSLMPETQDLIALKQRKEEAETQLVEEKLRQIRFKNEREEGQYLLTDEVQRELDGMLIRLQTNLYAIPETVVDSIMSSRDRVEAKEILLSALEAHMRDVSAFTINFEKGDD